MMPDTRTDHYRLTGLDCADCAMKLEGRLRALTGVDSAVVNFAVAKLTITHHADEDAILRTIRDAGFNVATETPSAHACACGSCHKAQPHFWETHWRLLITIGSGTLVAVAWMLEHTTASTLLPIALYLLGMLVGGYWTFRRGLSALRTLTFDMNALMTIAVTGAIIIGEWQEAGVVAFLYSLSNLLESYTMEKTRQSIRGLMTLAPADALVVRDGVEARLPVAEIRPGDVVIVKPAEKIAVDGTVLAGASAVNQAPITGEALPVEKRLGDPVYAGTLNTLGALEVRVTRTADDTTLAHIIHLVEEAQAQRAPSQRFIDRFARWYTPAALVVALLLAIVPPLVLPLLGIDAPWAAWFYRALALLVVACPCALVISTPVAIVTAIGNAARHGVLIKGGAHLEQAAGITVIAFDKTGTLTRGRPDVTDVIPLDGQAPDALLALAAAVERRAAHPLADAILREAAREGVAIPPADGFRALPGQGATAMVNDEPTYVGSSALFAGLGVPTDGATARVQTLQQQGKTAMLIGTEARVLGIIAAADSVRPESPSTIRALHKAGIRQVAMLTGDHADVANALAASLHINEVKANLLPEDKTAAVQALQAEHGAVAMVGDGINDAPALATADLGIAMGAAGTDTALETADIALMADDLSKLPYMLRLSRHTLGIIKQNIALALGLKALALVLIFPGWLTLWLAVLADMGATILVTLNALRLLHERPRDEANAPH
jgi:Cd2+/Zn2+-exporting ATPase